MALILSTIATGLDGDNQQLKDWIFWISVIGIILSVMLLPVGWHGEKRLEETEIKLLKAQAINHEMAEVIKRQRKQIASLIQQGNPANAPLVSPKNSVGLPTRIRQAAGILFGREER